MSPPQDTAPPPDQPIRAVTFDMDGLLANSEDVYLHVGTETLRRRGKPFEDELRHKMMGRPAPIALGIMIEWHGLSDTVEELAIEGEELFWHFADELHELKPMPGVGELFDWLDERGLPRGVATSGHRSYAERILRLVGVRDRVEFIISADDVTIGKPNPEPYLMAADKHGVPPEAMMVLEDSGVGSQAGVASGAYAVAVPNHHTAEHPFDGVRFIANTLEDPRIRQVLSHG